VDGYNRSYTAGTCGGSSYTTSNTAADWTIQVPTIVQRNRIR